jgi:hypothetical protein
VSPSTPKFSSSASASLRRRCAFKNLILSAIKCQERHTLRPVPEPIITPSLPPVPGTTDEDDDAVAAAATGVVAAAPVAVPSAAEAGAGAEVTTEGAAGAAPGDPTTALPAVPGKPASPVPADDKPRARRTAGEAIADIVVLPAPVLPLPRAPGDASGSGALPVTPVAVASGAGTAQTSGWEDGFTACREGDYSSFNHTQMRT